jgi:hypothetical protein
MEKADRFSGSPVTGPPHRLETLSYLPEAC